MHVPVEFHRTSDWTCFVAGYFSNGALLWLVAKRSEPELLAYRPILVLFSVINLLYLAVVAVVVPVMPLERGCHAAFSVGPLGQWLSQPYNFALTFSWNFLFFFSIVAQPVPFVYRYVLLCTKRDISGYGLRHYLAILTCPLAVSVGHVLNCYATGYVPAGEHHQRLIRQRFFHNESSFFVPYFVDEVGTLRIAAYFGSSVALSYLLVVAFGWRIYRHLKHEATTKLNEKRAREINQQVSHTLLLLALIPLAVETLPGLWLTVTAVAGLHVGNVSVYSTAVFAWAPVINPLATVWVVKAFRREVCKWLEWLIVPCGWYANNININNNYNNNTTVRLAPSKQ